MTKNILIVDDDQAFGAMIQYVLQMDGYKVSTTKYGDLALLFIREENIDLVITDILMPYIEGIELACEIKKMKPDLKIIGMTGGGQYLSRENVKEMCPKYFFDHVLLKPFSFEDLLETIKSLLK